MKPPSLRLKCNACGKAAAYEVADVLVHPEVAKCQAEGWDGVFLGRIIVCKHCGAQDDYKLSGDTYLRLTGQILAREDGETSSTPNVQLGTAVLWDGTVVRRASQGLAVLREAAAKEPSRAAGWRRLGNFALRCGTREEAQEAYKKAVEVDDREAEAAVSLAEILWMSEEFPQAIPYIDIAIRRVCRCDASPELRLEIARSALSFVWASLRTSSGPLALTASWSCGPTQNGSPVVRVSSVNLRELSDRQWKELAKFLADPNTIGASLTEELPDPRERTQLAALLDRRVIPGLLSYVPTPPGKNRPCPCGSGKKRKLCCDRIAGTSA